MKLRLVSRLPTHADLSTVIIKGLWFAFLS